MKRITFVLLTVFFIFGILLLVQAAHSQAIDSSVHVNQFPGPDVATKLANAMKTCTMAPSSPCILVIDPSLAPMTAGAMPALCSNCYLADYRTGGPFAPIAGLPVRCVGTGGSSTAFACGNPRAGFTPSTGFQMIFVPNFTAGTHPTLSFNGGLAYRIVDSNLNWVAAGEFVAGSVQLLNLNYLVGPSVWAWIIVGNGGASSPSQQVIYASKIAGATPGVAVAAGSSATGTTDSASAINTAIAAGNIDLEVDSGFALSTSLVLASNTTIHCTSPQYGFIMQASSNAPVLVNSHRTAPTTSSGTGGYLVSNQTDSNIRVSGCMLNANSIQAVTGSGNPNHTAHTTNPSTGLMVPGLVFMGINGVRFEKNELYDTGEWGSLFTNDSNVFADQNYFHQPLPLVAFKNTSAVEIVGPDAYVEADGNIINAGDTSIEIAAEGCQRTGQSDCALTNFKWGPIQHVHIENTTLQNSYHGLLLLDASELVDDIDIGNTQGSICGNAFLLGEYSTLNSSFGAGNIGRVNIHGDKVQTTGTCPEWGNYNILLGLNIQDLTISDVQYANPAVSWPVLTVPSGGGTVGTLNLHGWDITTTSSSFLDILSLNGTVNNILASNITWNDSEGTGAFFSGSAVPTILTVSNYSGPNRLLASGFSPTNQKGDAFATASPSATWPPSVVRHK
jgi:hypothetical protein